MNADLESSTKPTVGSRWILAFVLAYACGLILYWPRIFSISDEASYVRQAVAFAHGRSTVALAVPFSSSPKAEIPSTYPVGTSALLAAFVFFGGWRAASAGPFLALLLTILILRRWLREEGRSAGFVLLMLGYPAVLVLSRIAMSDMPSTAVVTLGLWLFFKGRGRSWWISYASGLAAGAGLLFRETNALPFVAFYSGALVRRERRVLALGAGVATGIAARLLTNYLAQGQWLYLRPAYGFSFRSVLVNAPLYALPLLLFVPGGLVWVLAYRGRYRPELVGAVLLVVSFFLAYDYAGWEGGGLRRLVLGPRYFIPVLPLIVFAAAEVIPRWWHAIRDRYALTNTPARLVSVACGSIVVILGFVVHPVLASWGAGQAAIQENLYAHTRPDAAILTNLPVTGKYFNEIFGARRVIGRHLVEPGQLARVLEAHGLAQIATVERTDSSFYRNEAQGEMAYVAEARTFCRVDLAFEHQFPNSQRLQVWDVRSCRAGNAPALK
jgi:4-amino-4-deoxy-L-arabinose transferase-like glycosyltransferase